MTKLITAIDASVSARIPKENPMDIHTIPYEKELVLVVDALVNKAKNLGIKKTFEYTSADWEMVNFVYKLWTIIRPESSKQFENAMKEWRHRVSTNTNHGILKEGEARIQHQLEIPRRFYDLLKCIYPELSFDKKFSRSLAKHLPILKTTEDSL